MRKSSTPILILAVLTIVFSGQLLFKHNSVGAVESVKNEGTALPADTLLMMKESTDGGSMKDKSDYMLPYPGILPDHPLYFLKDFRDKIIEMLIVDPERKSEFYLLQSDKYLSASQSLIEKNQTEKAKMILTQSGTKMKMAVDQLSSLKANGRQVSAGSIDRLGKSIEKHFEILQEMASTLDTSETSSVMQKSEEELMKLK